MKPKVVLGLSGGVDSALAALLLKETYEVHCLWLDIGLGGGEDAETMAKWLDLPFYRGDIREDIEQQVCQPFIQEYLSAKTPLPCARCNPLVKFPGMLRLADEIGADFVATGHYARIQHTEEGRAVLCKGLPSNDQSYMLARLPQEILKRTLFPLGDYEKHQVRAMAKEQGIPVANKPDSMEICFIPEGDYAAWLEKHSQTPPPGNFVSPTGEVLGQHKGIHHYTVGQGRGLGISGPHRYFVSHIDPETDTVTLSDGSDLTAEHIYCTDPNWIGLSGLDQPTQVEVRLRHSKTQATGTITPYGDGVALDMDTPARAPTPGQLAVFYRGEQVLGSAWIEKKVTAWT